VALGYYPSWEFYRPEQGSHPCSLGSPLAHSLTARRSNICGAQAFCEFGALCAENGLIIPRVEPLGITRTVPIHDLLIHDVDDATAIWLAEEAERQGTSIERVAGQLLRRALEWERRQAELPTYHDLDDLAGTWNEEEAAAFLQAIADFEHVDSELWR
jgi:hypothetical protein